MKKPKLSVVITAHREGLVAHKTVLSVLAGLEKITEPWEVVVNIDNGDEVTEEYFSRYEDDRRFVINRTSLGDPGSARNAAIKVTRGKYVAVLDGDDMLSSSFFTEFFRIVKAHPKERIMVHPGATMQFGEGIYLTAWPQFDSESLDADTLKLVGVNRWTAAAAAAREVFLESPYVPSTNGYGYEDWWINQQTLAHGVKHYVAQAVLFYRKKTSDSMFMQHEADHTVVAYTDLLETARVKKIPLPPLAREKRTSAKGFAKRLIKFGYKVAITLPIVKIPALAVGRQAEKRLAERRYTSLPGYLLEGWEDIIQVETIIEKSPAAAEHICFQSYEDNYMGVVYRHIIEYMQPGKVDRLYMVSSRMSAAGKRTVRNSILRDRRIHPDWHIVVLAEGVGAPVDGVDYVGFGGLTKHLSRYEKDRMFSRLVVQLQTRDIVVAESEFFIQWVGDHQKYLSSNTFQITAMVFSREYIDPYLINAYPLFTKVMAADRKLVKELEQQYAFDPGKIKVINDAD
jgi:glycosyltransferase involved in cell wall biosynthesis